MKFENLTPYTLNIQLSNGEFATPLPPSSKGEARVAMSLTPNGMVGDVGTFIVEYGEITNLPEPEEDTIYIVSGMVEEALHDRPDVFSPGALIRDEHGRPVGCKGLKQTK